MHIDHRNMLIVYIEFLMCATYNLNIEEIFS